MGHGLGLLLRAFRQVNRLIDQAMDDDRAAQGLFRTLRRLWMASTAPTTVIVSLVVFGLQAVHSVLLARLLGPEGRGEYGSIMLFAQTMLYVGLFGTHYSIARAGTVETQSHSGLQSAAFRVGLITGVLSTFLAGLFCLLGLPPEKQYLMPLAFVCCLLLPAEHLRLTAQAVDHGRGNFNRYNVSRLFAAFVFPILIVTLYFAGIRSLVWIAWATVLASIIGYVFYWVLSDQKRVLRVDGEQPKARMLLWEARSDGALVIANDLYDRLATLLVLWLASLSDQGLYLTALPAATLLLVAPNAFELFAFRRAAKTDEPLTMASLLRYSVIFLTIQLVVAGALLLVIDPLIRLVYTEAFAGSVPLAKILILAMAANGITIICEGYLRGRKLAMLGIYTRLVAVPIMVVTVFFLTSLSPTTRIAVAVLLGHIANALLVAVFVWRDVRFLARENQRHGKDETPSDVRSERGNLKDTSGRDHGSDHGSDQGGAS